MVSPEEQVMTMRTSVADPTLQGWLVKGANGEDEGEAGVVTFGVFDKLAAVEGDKAWGVVVSVLGGVVVGSDVDLLPVKLGSHQPSRALEL